MADRVIERTETETPRDTVVVNDGPRDRGSHTGLIIGVILLVLLLLFLFGGGLFGGGGGGSTDVNVETPAPTAGQ